MPRPHHHPYPHHHPHPQSHRTRNRNRKRHRTPTHSTAYTYPCNLQTQSLLLALLLVCLASPCVGASAATLQSGTDVPLRQEQTQEQGQSGTTSQRDIDADRLLYERFLPLILHRRSRSRSTFRSAFRHRTSHAFVSPASARTHESGQGSPTPTADGRGYTLDDCWRDDDCAGDRVCVTNRDRDRCADGVGCVCLPAGSLSVAACRDCHDCADYAHETCQREAFTGAVYSSGGCLSVRLLLEERVTEEVGCATFPGVEPIDPYVTPTPSFSSTPTAVVEPPRATPSSSTGAPETGGGGGGEGHCIDAQLLRAQLPRADLLFPTDRTASVLCDQHGSCATPGHLVVFHSAPMAMRSYCNSPHTTCSAASARVNSPRYAPALRVRSRTPGLHFTALAARFETRVEEAVLKMAVRAGL